MKTYTRTIEIKAPPRRIYDFLTDPRNFLTIWPNMVSVSSSDGTTGRMRDFDWTFKLAGFPFAGHAKLERDDRGRFVRYRNESGIPSIFRWTYEALDGAATRLTLEVDYDVPASILMRLAESLVIKINERDTETMLANLKEVIESTPAGAIPHAA